MEMPVVETKDCIVVHVNAYHDITELDFEAASQGEASRKHRDSYCEHDVRWTKTLS
jgi:hypothetical protein